MSHIEKFEEGEVYHLPPDAEMAEKADAVASGTCEHKPVEVEGGSILPLHPEEAITEELDKIETALADETLSEKQKNELLQKKDFYQNLQNNIAA